MSEDDQLPAAEEWRELVRQARQMQTAYSVIQSIHGELSLEAIADGIVRSLVEIGGVSGAEISLDATFDTLHVSSSSHAGELASPTSRHQQFAIIARGVEVGTLAVHYDPDQNEAELLLESPRLRASYDLDGRRQRDLVPRGRSTIERTLEEKRVEERTAQLAEANQQLEGDVQCARRGETARSLLREHQPRDSDAAHDDPARDRRHHAVGRTRSARARATSSTRSTAVRDGCSIS